MWKWTCGVCSCHGERFFRICSVCRLRTRRHVMFQRRSLTCPGRHYRPPIGPPACSQVQENGLVMSGKRPRAPLPANDSCLVCTGDGADHCRQNATLPTVIEVPPCQAERLVLVSPPSQRAFILLSRWWTVDGRQHVARNNCVQSDKACWQLSSQLACTNINFATGCIRFVRDPGHRAA